MATFRYRFWALCQAARDLSQALDRPDHFVEVFDERARMLWSVLVRGHLGPLCLATLAALDDDVPELRISSILASDTWILHAVHERLAAFAKKGKEVGYLPGYLQAITTHIGRCPRCRNAAVASVRDEIKASIAVRETMRSLSPADRKRIVNEHLPPEIRARYDTDVN